VNGFLSFYEATVSRIKGFSSFCEATVDQIKGEIGQSILFLIGIYRKVPMVRYFIVQLSRSLKKIHVALTSNFF
jgi:hypothetical protein